MVILSLAESSVNGRVGACVKQYVVRGNQAAAESVWNRPMGLPSVSLQIAA